MMKFLIYRTSLILLSLFIVASKGLNAQKMSDEKGRELIFKKMSLQGVDMKQKLLYGYFFYDEKASDLESLKKELLKQSYKIVRLEKLEKSYILHAEKVESHSAETLKKREELLRLLAVKYSVDSYDGWDVGNIDPKKPLSTKEIFEKYLASKKKEELFDFATELYNLEMHTEAFMAFDLCCVKGIKSDTSYYKLANCLIELKQIDLGIAQYEYAIKLNPKYYSAYFNVASVCYDNYKYEKSLQYYEKATKLDPKDSRAFYGVAANQYALGQIKESEKNCNYALKLDPNNENALILKKMLEGK